MNHFGIRVASPTEQVNTRTAELDAVSTLELVCLLHEEDRTVPDAVAVVLPRLAALVDDAAMRVTDGGRVHYFGAGTSGRLGVLDAAELLPTFGLPDDVVIAHQAGGAKALVRAVEDAEDEDHGADAADVTEADMVIGLTASGRTPYVGAALTAARTAGAATALITSNPNASLAEFADHLLVADTGPEAITGSTRLKAGTAQKLILNAFSTALMVRLGHTYRNLMVDMRATNAKLRGRTMRLLVQATGADDAECAEALDLCGDLKTALVFLLARRHTAAAPQQCRAALEMSGGRVRQALATLNVDPSPPADLQA
ncbi:N-acetylmuramic acid 6-phosphate etherase [Actinoallomurus sp. NPDC050550]|uniref:N-acetylmuramic acid 6-phosphate etherase n=1 Tax=Actinoallomurus sp. NPDC050550 TaxID=3154937 RepID=UPI00341161C6